MKRAIALSIQATVALCTVLSAFAVAADAPRPNIVVIMCDDLGYADVGFNGAKDLVTPTLDRLAKNGTISKMEAV